MILLLILFPSLYLLPLPFNIFFLLHFFVHSFPLVPLSFLLLQFYVTRFVLSREQKIIICIQIPASAIFCVFHFPNSELVISLKLSVAMLFCQKMVFSIHIILFCFDTVWLSVKLSNLPTGSILNSNLNILDFCHWHN